MASWTRGALIGFVTWIAAGTSGAICVGDCNGDSAVVINELVTGVSVTLGSRALATCRNFDPDANESVAINELVQGVRSAIDGCPRVGLTAFATSNHYVDVRFENPVGAGGDDPQSYRIEGPDGSPLAVFAARINAERTVVTLTTAAQASVRYQLTFVPTADEAPFDGSTLGEGRLLRARALDHTHILLIFDVDLYSDLAPPTPDVPPGIYLLDPASYPTLGDGLQVIAVTIPPAGLPGVEPRRTIILTTSGQLPVDYQVRADGVVDVNGRHIDPDFLAAAFTGIALTDLIAPHITNVVTTGAQTVVLTFSEPLAPTAADPRLFLISPLVEVTGAQLTNYGTNVILSTGPQVPGLTYTITVAGVSDLAGNVIVPGNGNTMVFPSSGTQPVDDDELPRIVSAAATSNTTVIVQFSQAMDDSVLRPEHYVIKPQTDNPQAGTLLIESVRFVDASRITVELTTRAQASLIYGLTAVNVRDVRGLPLAPVEIVAGAVIDPTSTSFPGIPPACAEGETGCEVDDADGDGLPDHEEQRGWLVQITLTDGRHVVRGVSSDPDVADSDGDGLSDYEEVQLGTDPRDVDTDDDNADDYYEWNVVYSSPVAQDSDDDGFYDGLELYLRTSPVLADSDGDELADGDEILLFNRDPRVADIPDVGIRVGNVRLQLDELFTYTDETGETVAEEKSTATSLSRDESEVFVSEHERFDNYLDEFSAGVQFGIDGSGVADDSCPAEGACIGGATLLANIQRTQQWGNGDTFVTTSEQAEASQEVFEETAAEVRERATTSTVTREVVGARIDIDLTLENPSDIAFTVTNLEVTVLQRNPLDSRLTLTPVATLVATSQLATGDPLTVTLGPVTRVKGPFVFTSRDVTVGLVQEIMRNPNGLVFRVANYDISDELGRNFAFASQHVRERTAQIIIDSGDMGDTRYFVSTAGARDDDNLAGGGFVGGFEANGAPKGLPLDYVLQGILGLTRYQPGVTQPDGVVAGANRMADTYAEGDDVQLIPPGTTGLSVGSVIVGAGANGAIDSTPRGDDALEVVTGYETSRTCDQLSANAFEPCTQDLECQPTSPGSGFCAAPERLVRVGSLRNGDFNRAWFVIGTGDLPTAADFGALLARPGEDITLAFLQDLDGDGLTDREEFLAGSIDSAIDRFDNSTFGVDFDLDAALANAPPPGTPKDGIPDSRDSDADGLGDYAEVRVGWTVATESGLQQVFSSPRVRDSDGDALQDLTESDLSEFCAPNDPRSEALCAFQLDPVAQIDASAIVAGPNGERDSAAANDDVVLVPVGTTGLAYSAPVIGPGPNGVIDTPLAGDDLYTSSSLRPPATDPSRPDTDGDGLRDGDELNGFAAALAIIDGGNGIADTVAAGDDVQRGDLDQPVIARGVVVLPGPNRRIDSVATSDDVLRPARQVVTDPLRLDTDGDTLADGVEVEVGSDPTIADGADFRDADADGLTDGEETDLGWPVAVDGGAPSNRKASPYVVDTDFDGLPDLVERFERTDPTNADTDGDGIGDFDEVADFATYVRLAAPYPQVVINGSASRRYGTDPRRRDSDGDGLTDFEELVTGYLFGGGSNGEVRRIFSNPRLPDTDGDGLNDRAERDRLVDGQAAASDASDADTDGDGKTDGFEVTRSNTDPLEPDHRVTVSFQHLNVYGLQRANVAIDGNLAWWFLLTTPDGVPHLINHSAIPLSESENTSVVGQVTPLIEDFSPDGNRFINRSTCTAMRIDADRRYLLDTAAYDDRTQNSFRLRQGESFAVHGLWVDVEVLPPVTLPSTYIRHIEDVTCGLPPSFIPRIFDSTCFKDFRFDYDFDDVTSTVGGGTQIIRERLTDSYTSRTQEDCDVELAIEIRVE